MGRARLAGLAAMLVLALFTVQGAAAHYIDLRGKLVREGVLTLGVALVGPPFSWREDGRLRGFEIDFAAAVAESRGLDFEAVQLPRARLAEALLAGEVDAVNALALAEPPPPGLAALPFFRVGDHMMVLKANPFRLGGVEDLAGLTVSATMGTSAEAYAHELNTRLEDNGLTAMNIHALPEQRMTHFPVSMGHAAAYFVGSVSALAPSRDPESRVRVFEGVFRPRREVGFALRAGERDLYDALKHGLAAKVANGTYERLRREYGLPDDLSLFR